MTRQRQWLTDAAEALPSAIFILLLRSGIDLEVAGWTGVGLAALQLVIFRAADLKHNPVMLGVNVHLLIITPVIVGLAWSGALGLSRFLEEHAYEGVVTTVFVTLLIQALIQTLIQSPRQSTSQELGQNRAGKADLIMICAAAVAAVWAHTSTGGPLFSVAIPLIMLIALRRYLTRNSANIRNEQGEASPTTP